jgi:hypothetical protein
VFKYVGKTWREITQDQAGHTVAKDLFKALSYLAGIFYLFLLVPFILLRTGITLPLEVAIILLGNGLSLDVIKEVKNYNLRRTADGTGAPLATQDSVLPPSTGPEIMPTALIEECPKSVE